MSASNQLVWFYLFVTAVSILVRGCDGAASRTLVLGGGIYNDNNTHFYQTIIDLAVSYVTTSLISFYIMLINI